jgi:hypothetical protein
MMRKYAYDESLYAVLHAWLLMYGTSLLIGTRPRAEENVHTTAVLLVFFLSFIQIPASQKRKLIKIASKIYYHTLFQKLKLNGSADQNNCAV